MKFAGGTDGKGAFEPGWRWSELVRPTAGTDRRQSSHLAYCVSGRTIARMVDGTEDEIGPTDDVSISPGHDAWVVGTAPCIQVDFTGRDAYAEPS